jgi:hypothetical protein
MLGTSADQAAWTSSADSSSGAGAQMYAENRGADSDDERPPEMMMPTGSSDDACVLFFILRRGVRCVPGTVGDTYSQGTHDASELKIRNTLSV